MEGWKGHMDWVILVDEILQNMASMLEILLKEAFVLLLAIPVINWETTIILLKDSVVLL